MTDGLKYQGFLVFDPNHDGVLSIDETRNIFGDTPDAASQIARLIVQRQSEFVSSQDVSLLNWKNWVAAPIALDPLSDIYDYWDGLKKLAPDAASQIRIHLTHSPLVSVAPMSSVVDGCLQAMIFVRGRVFVVAKELTDSIAPEQFYENALMIAESLSFVDAAMLTTLAKGQTWKNSNLNRDFNQNEFRESPLRFRLTPSLEGRLATYDAVNNEIELEYNLSYNTVLHEIDHAIDDALAPDIYDHRPQYDSDLNDHVANDPRYQACLARQRLLMRANLEGKSQGWLGQIRLGRQSRVVLMRGAATVYSCSNRHEFVAGTGWFTGAKTMTGFFEMLPDQFDYIHDSSAHQAMLKASLQDLISNGLCSGDSEIRKHAYRALDQILPAIFAKGLLPDLMQAVQKTLNSNKIPPFLKDEMITYFMACDQFPANAKNQIGQR